jgi:hypothetical protein
MYNDECLLLGIPEDNPNYKLAQDLLKEINDFRLWSWREVDRDDFFYKKIEEFDKRTFMLI